MPDVSASRRTCRRTASSGHLWPRRLAAPGLPVPVLPTGRRRRLARHRRPRRAEPLAWRAQRASARRYEQDRPPVAPAGLVPPRPATGPPGAWRAGLARASAPSPRYRGARSRRRPTPGERLCDPGWDRSAARPVGHRSAARQGQTPALQWPSWRWAASASRALRGAGPAWWGPTSGPGQAAALRGLWWRRAALASPAPSGAGPRCEPRRDRRGPGSAGTPPAVGDRPRPACGPAPRRSARGSVRHVTAPARAPPVPVDRSAPLVLVDGSEVPVLAVGSGCSPAGPSAPPILVRGRAARRARDGADRWPVQGLAGHLVTGALAVSS